MLFAINLNYLLFKYLSGYTINDYKWLAEEGFSDLRNKKTRFTTDFTLSLAALGVVFGDIGTSPLYAMRACLYGLSIDQSNVLGILSLIFWSLIIVISVKYLIILFRADNDGEGGVLSLIALLKQFDKKKVNIFFVMGMFGAGLLLGDGMLTPAISVLSAIEGLDIIFPSMSYWVLPLTILILIGIFSVQSLGTARIGFIFGPIILIWFLILGVLGILQIIQNPIVIKALNPFFAFEFFHQHGWTAYALLGGVFLVVTGGEALYADLGHFGKKPIRMSWFYVVLPGLVLNYFGQGAYLLSNPEGIINPFYMLAPGWFSVILLIFATMATIIASQAVITATFSLTKQAVLLGLYPHLPIVQTSREAKGQIYIPQMNLILALGTVSLVLLFKSTDALTHAYGIAVNLDMLITNILVCYLAIKKWRWNPIVLFLVFTTLATIDLAFLGANLQKLWTGGWLPIIFALVCTFIMYTWYAGRLALCETHYMKKSDFSKILKQLDYQSLYRLADATAIFITDVYDKSGGSFLHFLKMNRTLPEHVLIVNYLVDNIPYVSSQNRFEISCLSKNICELTLHYGYMDTVSVPQALYVANDRGLLPFKFNIDTATYLIEIPNVVASRKKQTLWFYWQEKLFAFLVRNYSTNLNIEFYQVPFNRTMAIGTYYII